MTSISGTIRIGEAHATAAATARRQRGSSAWIWVVTALLVFGLGLAGVALSMVAEVDPIIGALLGMLTGALIYRRWCSILTVWRFRKTQAANGVPLDLPIRLEATADAIVYRMGDIESRAPWHAVSEIFHEKGWWIVMVQASPMFAADRFFKDEVEQRAFVSEVLAHMNDAARARSGDAVKFVGG